LRAAEGSTAVLNAANEEAVAAFLSGTIRFTDIHKVNADTIDAVLPDLPTEARLTDLLALDTRARSHARAIVRELAR
jgi:1-deoxy-D-xylulose-5-phosphate reductoisomerase